MVMNKDKVRKLLNKKRFKCFRNGYVIDRYLIRFTMLIIIIGYSLLLIGHNFDISQKVYFICPLNSPAGGCVNPFYCDPVTFNNCDKDFGVDIPNHIRGMDHFPSGFEFGSKPNNFFKFFPLWVFSMLGLAFLINHIKHNKV